MQVIMPYVPYDPIVFEVPSLTFSSKILKGNQLQIPCILPWLKGFENKIGKPKDKEIFNEFHSLISASQHAEHYAFTIGPFKQQIGLNQPLQTQINLLLCIINSSFYLVHRS